MVAPDVGEVEMGSTLRDVTDAVGSGLPDGRSVKAVFSGVANPVITGDQLDVPLTYEDFVAIGSGMGSAGFIVHDDTSCMVNAADVYSRFLAVEEQQMVSSVLRAFPEEFAEHVELGRCPRPRSIPMPEITELEGGRVTDDQSFWRKRPDWTYDPE